MRREGGRVLIDLSHGDGERLCRLPLKIRGEPFPSADGRFHFIYSESSFLTLLMALGIEAGAADRTTGVRGRGSEFWAWIALANAINEGNPQWTPYEVPEEGKGRV